MKQIKMGQLRSQWPAKWAIPCWWRDCFKTHRIDVTQGDGDEYSAADLIHAYDRELSFFNLSKKQIRK